MTDSGLESDDESADLTIMAERKKRRSAGYPGLECACFLLSEAC